MPRRGKIDAVILVGVAVTVAALLAGVGIYLIRRNSDTAAANTTGRETTNVSTSASAVIDPLAVDLEGGDHTIVAAIRQAQNSVRSEPQSAEHWGRLGMTLHAHDFDKEAAVAYAKAAERSPREAKWPYLHAVAIAPQDPRDAVPLFTSAAELYVDRPNLARLRLLELLLDLGRLPQANHQAEKLLGESPHDPWVNLAAARLHHLQQETDVCLQFLKHAQEIDDTRRPAHQLAADIYRRSGKPSEADQHQALADAARPRTREDPYFKEMQLLRTGLRMQLKRANELIEYKRLSEAVAVLRSALEEYPRSDLGWMMLGKALIRNQRFAEAEKALEKALAIVPINEEALFYLGLALQRQSRYPEAASRYRRALVQRVDFAEAHHNLAICLSQMEDMTGAIRHYELCVGTDPSVHTLVQRKELVQLLMREGQFERALAHVQVMRKLQPEAPGGEELESFLRRKIQPRADKD